MKGLIHRRLVDKMMDAYVTWHEACLRVTDAYRSWAGTTGPGASFAFSRYRAALEQEERAAEVYARMVERVSRLTTDRTPFRALGAGAVGPNPR
jgi:hypothetical protein